MAKGNPPEPQDLTGDELRSDLHRFEVSGLWGIGKVKFSSTANSVGPVIALLVLLAGAGCAGYLVHQLAVDTLQPIPALCLTLATALVVFAVGIWLIWFVTKTNQIKKDKNRKNG
ncbi:hypothetical protein [Mycolicibacterium mageritense]|uniref:hypothetical protein n=1 Tax=Mycolicibacterium mageritense TaxID=53462 RepID=UPI001E3A6E50|nr:hypothetical protein [Mycolicibacterium mageritense]GJJ24120.1 hypothetical protein MTY414_77940 [Mycolicibacterium mageritense]